MLKHLIAASGFVAIGLATAPAVLAQAGQPTFVDYWGGRSKSATANCPLLEWTIVPIARDTAGAANGPINGVVYYGDMSGIATVKGTIGADGKIAAHVTSVYGKGPSGTVTGMRGPKGTHVDLRGEGCANAAFDLPRWQMPTQGGE